MSAIDHVVIIGAGSWGTALAHVISANTKKVSLIARSKETVEAINTTKKNPKYLTNLTLAQNVTANSELSLASCADLIIIAVPTSGIRNTTQILKELGIKKTAMLVTVSKGIERGSGLRMSQVIQEILPNNPVGVLSGPNHAEEVSLNLPTCTVLGFEDLAKATELQPIFCSSNFRTYTSDDLPGIEWGGAIKNTFAIAAGIARGLSLGDNAVAALVTRGLAEMIRLGMEMGAKQITFSGLSGVGDLMTTCYSPHSRNHQIGLALAKGNTVAEAEKKLGMVAEGVRNTQSIYEESKKLGVDTPLIDAVYGILYKGVSPAEALTSLFTRELKGE